MKVFLVNFLFVASVTTHAYYTLVPMHQDDPLVTVDTRQLERITQQAFDELIAQEYEKDKQYLLAQITTQRGVDYFDGQATHHYFKLNKLPPNGQKDCRIDYFLLTAFETTPIFRYYTSEGGAEQAQENQEVYFTAQDGTTSDLLAVGNDLIAKKQYQVGVEILVRAYQDCSFWDCWKVYQGLECVIFPDKPDTLLGYYYNKSVLTAHFLKDIFWP